MAGLVGRIPIGQIGPLGSGSQNPQDPIQYLPAAAPGAAPAIGAFGQLADQRFKHAPLFVRYVHGRCILLWDTAYHPFMR